MLIAGTVLASGIGAAPAAEQESPAGAPPRVSEGFWPTSRMIDLMIRRVAAEASDKYDLRPDQRQRMEEKMLQRWSRFLEDNRGQMQPLVNEYIEARLALEPPSADQVAEWAARAMPLYQKLRANVEDAETEVRALLNAHQQAKFDMERLKRNMGLQVFESKLKRWSVGAFKEHEWWSPPGARRRRRARADARDEAPPGEQRDGAEAADAELPERIRAEFSAWQAFVEVFCDKFDLDLSQRNAAQSMLREISNRAHDYVHLRRERMAALETKIANPAGVDETEFRKKLEELYGPLDQMFRELQERLNRLPTPGQRLRAQNNE